ncbi:gliding motility-associated C-terminal domain-containing protein [Zobellia laminariae]|uniref:gliding motility-associated C-terminal domain-containing protein n=1 Tax=Zobellia laminariae TaxID=248906 RepID=UPI0026F47085|nr:gliding motility-associated C-terminal domain-containing protein [Zobellia laminariae]WKX77201.1 gliding motility-associated C-terminal domain-containing protein [Zobellia laminariae]
MKKYAIIIGSLVLSMYSNNMVAQDSFHNFGNMKMHEDAQIGFYQNLINDGSFDDNKGLAGFYNEDIAYISGAFRPVFKDLEIVVDKDLILEVGIGITNNSNFISGDLVTPKFLVDTNIEYINDAFYNGDTNFTKVDGYSAVRNKQDFTFPVGHFDKLRPLKLSSDLINENAKSAYFFEDPNHPSTFHTTFSTENRTDILVSISNEEFWDLDTEVSSKVTLGWDTDSSLSSFIDDVENLRVVGWHTEHSIWEDLGNTAMEGDFNQGEITSDVFTPDDYTIITFGGSLSRQSVDLGNYLMTPNGDGKADFLVLEAVSLSPNNQLTIYNRWGRAVYEATNYDNTFGGTANVSSVVATSKKLPAGVYFYIIDLKDIDVKHQGFLYINQE